MNELLNEFKSESLGLLEQMEEILEYVEDHPQDQVQMENFGQLIDRIMGGAKSLALTQGKDASLDTLSAFGEIGKLLGYKSSQLDVQKQKKHAELLNVTIAFLFDAIDHMRMLTNRLGITQPNESEISKTFLDRLRWIAQQFDANVRATVEIRSQTKGAEKKESSSQQIESLLKQMGVKN